MFFGNLNLLLCFTVLVAVAVAKGSSSNDDGDIDENGKKAMGSISKTTTLHVHHAFLYISLPSLHVCDVKFLISRSVEDVNIRQRISFSFSNLAYSAFEFYSRTIHQH